MDFMHTSLYIGGRLNELRVYVDVLELGVEENRIPGHGDANGKSKQSRLGGMSNIGWHMPSAIVVTG